MLQANVRGHLTRQRTRSLSSSAETADVVMEEAPPPRGALSDDVSHDGTVATASTSQGPRLVFRRACNHRPDERWDERPIRSSSTTKLSYAFNISADTYLDLMDLDLLQVLLRDHGYSREEDWSNSSKPFSLFWYLGELQQDRYALLKTLKPFQRLNKLPGASVLTIKSELWRITNAMKEEHGHTHYSFMPLSFVLPQEKDLYEAFLRLRFAEQSQKQSDAVCSSGASDQKVFFDVWILKPEQLSKGTGIFLHRPGPESKGGSAGAAPWLQFGQFAKKVDRDESPPSMAFPERVQKHQGVASSYIHPPLLIDNYKFDIRLYVLITCAHPLTLYVYHEGLARFATEEYDTSVLDQSLDRRCMHLTNYSLNKKEGNFVRNTSEEEDGIGSKWSLTALRKRLVQRLGHEAASKVWKEVDDVLVKTVVAAEPSLAAAAAEHHSSSSSDQPVRTCFQLFGFDVMLDADCKPWLLEVNCDPALGTDSPLDLKIKSSMLVDAFNVIGMPAVGGFSASNASNASDFARWKGANPDAVKGDEEAIRRRWATHLVDEEFGRSKETAWRRLFPSERSEEYRPFVSKERPWHFLPVAV